LSGEYDDIKMQTSEDRCKSLAKAIHDLDADVLCLEEVEGEDALRWFRDTYLKDMGYDFLASKEVGYYRGVEQSLLSRFPIKDVQIWTTEDLAPMEKYIPKDTDQRKKEGWGDDPKVKEPLKFQRSPLKATIDLPSGQELTIYVVHHKAGGKATAHHRELESLRMNEMVKADLAKNPDAFVAVVGDFNATPMEKAAKLYRDKDFAGLVSAYEFRPEAGQAKEKKSAAPDATDSSAQADGSADANSDESDAKSDANSKADAKSKAAEKLAAKNLYLTHITNRSIDYILLSPALVKIAVPKSFFVFGTLMPGSDYDYKKDQPPTGYASDHCPIAIDLKIATTNSAKPKTDAATPPAAKEVAK
jgi:endonuclease/exonuclease/phosphatase family metal-dependent hydrolase